jgi:phosphoglycolate phosphatase-like HAD superfamily hydrolase
MAIAPQDSVGHRDERAQGNCGAWIDVNKTRVVTGDRVKYAKPDPDLFIAAAERLGAGAETAVVLGDSIWDMLAAKRCKALGAGLLSGGYGSRELQDAGAISRLRGSRRCAAPHR